MLQTVVKRDGRIVDFDPEKIRLAVSLAMEKTDTGVDLSVIEKIVEYVKNKNVSRLSVEDIHNIVEKRLMASSRKDAAREYVKERHRRDVARQSKSKVVFDEIVSAKATDVTRENANMNADTPAGMMMKFASETTKPFVDNYLISADVEELVNTNLIHIHDKDYYPTKSLTCLAGDTPITLKTSRGNIIHTTISFFDRYINEDNVTEIPENAQIDETYFIEGRNGWTKVKGVSKRKLSDDDKYYRIRTSGGLELKITGTHHIPIRDMYLEDILVPVSALREGAEIYRYSAMMESDNCIDVVREIRGSNVGTDLDIFVSDLEYLRDWLHETQNGDIPDDCVEISMDDYIALTDNLDVPAGIKNTLSIHIRNSNETLPVLLPVTPQFAEIVAAFQICGSVESSMFMMIDEDRIALIKDNLSDIFGDVTSDVTVITPDEGKSAGGLRVENRLVSLLLQSIDSRKYTEGVPSFIKNAEEDIIIRYLAVALTGVRSVTSERVIRTSTPSKELAKGIIALVRRIGMTARYKNIGNKSNAYVTEQGAPLPENDLYSIYLDAENAQMFVRTVECLVNAISRPDYADYNIDTVLYENEQIVSIEELPKEGVSVYDIETVEHWFLANEILVHNCIQHPLDKIFENGFKAGHGEARPPKRIETASILACISMETVQNEMHGGQAIPAFDFYLAPFVRSTYIEEVKKLEDFCGSDFSSLYNTEIKDYLKKPVGELEGLEKIKQSAINNTVTRVHQSMEAFIHNMNTIHSRGGNQVVFSSINYGTDTSAEGRCISREVLLSTYDGVGNGSTAIFPIHIWKKKRGVSYLPEDPNYDLYKLACKVSAKRFFPNFLNLDATYNTDPLWNPEDPKRYIHEVATMGCRTRVYSDKFGESTSVGRGNLSFTTINLPKIAILSAIKTGALVKTENDGAIRSVYGDPSLSDVEKNEILENAVAEFMTELDKCIEVTAKQLHERYVFQSTAMAKQFPLLMSGLWVGSEKLSPDDTIAEVIRHGTLGIGYIGLAETLVALTGHHHGESDLSQEIGIRIVREIYDKCKEYSESYDHNYSAFATPAEGLSGKFTKKDREVFGEIEGVTDKDYYTNSNHVPVWYKCSAKHKAEVEGPYHELTPAGHIFYVEMDGELENNPEAIMNVVDLMDKYNIGYGSVNHSVSRCEGCSHESSTEFPVNDAGELVCPVCGSTQVTHLQRITGYLVGSTERWNNGKLSELRDRVTHMDTKK